MHLYLQFIDDPGLRNDAKLKPIQLPLCQSSSHTLTSTTREKTSHAAHSVTSSSLSHSTDVRV